MTPRKPKVPAFRTTLGPRGQRLWDQALKAKTFNAGETVVLEEACRLADRLDRLARILDGDEAAWGRIVDSRTDEDRAELVIDQALSAARLHASSLAKLIDELDLPGAEEVGEGKPVVVDPLAAAREARAARRKADPAAL